MPQIVVPGACCCGDGTIPPGPGNTCCPPDHVYPDKMYATFDAPGCPALDGVVTEFPSFFSKTLGTTTIDGRQCYLCCDMSLHCYPEGNDFYWWLNINLWISCVRPPSPVQPPYVPCEFQFKYCWQCGGVIPKSEMCNRPLFTTVIFPASDFCPWACSPFDGCMPPVTVTLSE